MTLFLLLLATPPLLGALGCGSATGAGTADAGADAGEDAGGCPAPGKRPDRRSESVVVLAGTDLVIFGGTTAVPDNCNIPAPVFTGETWRYDTVCGVFTRVEGEGPGPRARAMGAWDPVGNRVLIFGGRTRTGSTGSYTLFDDLWALDESGWTLVESGGSGPRVGGAMGVDPADGRVWIFGGDSSISGAAYLPRNDTWSYDPGGGGWAEATPAGSPAARLLVAYAFDGGRHRLLVWGGIDNLIATSYFADLWALDVTAPASPSWTELDDGTGSAPEGRFFSAMAWDGVNDRYLVFGGHDAGNLGNRNDLWAFDAGAGSWSQLGIGDTFANPAIGFCDFPKDFTNVDLASPERRSAHGQAAGAGSLWVFGGKSDCGALDDVWSFDGAWHERAAATEGEVCLRFFADTQYECQGLCL
jgi:hypothetical protein